MLDLVRSTTKTMSEQLVRALFPPQCLACSVELDTDGFCGKCWGETQFITGAVCDACGVMLEGDHEAGEFCDICLRDPPQWQRGRAAAVYYGGAAKSVMALKYGDRWDLARPLAQYMIAAGAPVLDADIIAPVPLHWTRMAKRKFNQASLLSNEISKAKGIAHIPDLLRRVRKTKIQKSMDREERFDNLREAFEVSKSYQSKIAGQRVLLVDDVMTSGATLSACAAACRAHGSGDVNVLVFARVAQSEVIY